MNGVMNFLMQSELTDDFWLGNWNHLYFFENLVVFKTRDF